MNRLPSLGAMIGLPTVDERVRRPLAIALATSVISVLGVQLVFPLLPAMAEVLRVRPETIGVVVAAYAATIAIVVPFAGVLADRRGRRPLLVAGLTIFGLSGVVLGFASTIEVVVFLRVIQGIGAGMVLPLTIVLLSDLIPPPHETSVQGLKVVLDRVAVMALPVVAGVLSIVAWPLPFLIFGLALPLALAALCWMPETRPEQPRQPMRGYLRIAVRGASRPQVMVGLVAGSARFFLDYGFLTFLPVHLALTVGLSAAEIGLVMAGYGLGAIGTASQAGRLARSRDPAAFVAAGFALMGFSLVLVPIVTSGGMVAACAFGYGLGNGIVSPLQKSVMTRNAQPEALAAIVAADRTFQQVAKALGPLGMGVVFAASGIGAVFYALGVVALGAVALVGLLLAAGESRAAETTAKS